MLILICGLSFINAFKHVSILIIVIIITCIPVLIFINNLIINKYFSIKNDKYVAIATDKIKKLHPIIIGITGSFGKTGCKNILKDMLKLKYSVYATQGNYNTPMGICLSINELSDEQIFIVEMGARRKGDIAEITKFISPDYAIITGVAPQHLATFKNLHNIYVEKFSLAKAVSEYGLCVFNGNDKNTLKMYKEYTGNKMKASVNKYGDIIIKNVEMGDYGSKFDIEYDAKTYSCATKLLGKHNLQNIAMCACLAVKLGLEITEIIDVIKDLKPTPHRLEYSYANGIHILDDSYNGNVCGVKYALDCLNYFSNRKVVLAQGIVELGSKQREINIKLGAEISKTADVIILVGSNRGYLKRGIIRSNYTGEQYSFSSLKKARKNFRKILRTNDVLLLQNDLPDIY